MPIEIRELVIRAVVIPEPEQEQDLADMDHRPPRRDLPEDRQVIIQECVRQVLSILRREEDR